jgi:hypothetical protein
MTRVAPPARSARYKDAIRKGGCKERPPSAVGKAASVVWVVEDVRYVVVVFVGVVD